MNVFDRIDDIRKERKMSRRQLAKKAGIPPSTFQSAMERKRNLSAENLEKLANALGVEVSDFYFKVSVGWGDEPVQPLSLKSLEDYQEEKIRQETFNAFELLNQQGKLKARDYIIDLSAVSKYRYGETDD